MDKKKSRIRRATRTRHKIKKLDSIRLTVHRSSRHIYAQIITSRDSKVLVSASTLEKTLVNQNTGNINAASIIGTVIAKRAIKKDIRYVSFDRSGFKYHGRIKALADSAREAGLKF